MLDSDSKCWGKCSKCWSRLQRLSITKHMLHPIALELLEYLKVYRAECAVGLRYTLGKEQMYTRRYQVSWGLELERSKRG